MTHTLTLLTQLNEKEAIKFSKQLRLSYEILSKYEVGALEPQQYLDLISNTHDLPEYMLSITSEQLLTVREIFTSTLN